MQERAPAVPSQGELTELEWGAVRDALKRIRAGKTEAQRERLRDEELASPANNFSAAQKDRLRDVFDAALTATPGVEEEPAPMVEDWEQQQGRLQAFTEATPPGFLPGRIPVWDHPDGYGVVREGRSGEWTFHIVRPGGSNRFPKRDSAGKVVREGGKAVREARFYHPERGGDASQKWLTEEAHREAAAHGETGVEPAANPEPEGKAVGALLEEVREKEQTLKEEGIPVASAEEQAPPAPLSPPPSLPAEAPPREAPAPEPAPETKARTAAPKIFAPRNEGPFDPGAEGWAKPFEAHEAEQKANAKREQLLKKAVGDALEDQVGQLNAQAREEKAAEIEGLLRQVKEKHEAQRPPLEETPPAAWEASGKETLKAQREAGERSAEIKKLEEKIRKRGEELSRRIEQEIPQHKNWIERRLEEYRALPLWKKVGIGLGLSALGAGSLLVGGTPGIVAATFFCGAGRSFSALVAGYAVYSLALRNRERNRSNRIVAGMYGAAAAAASAVVVPRLVQIAGTELGIYDWVGHHLPDWLRAQAPLPPTEPTLDHSAAPVPAPHPNPEMPAAPASVRLFDEPVTVTGSDAKKGLWGILERKLTEQGILTRGTPLQDRNHLLNLLEGKLRGLSSEKLQALGFRPDQHGRIFIDVIRPGEKLDLSLLNESLPQVHEVSPPASAHVELA